MGDNVFVDQKTEVPVMTKEEAENEALFIRRVIDIDKTDAKTTGEPTGRLYEGWSKEMDKYRASEPEKYMYQEAIVVLETELMESLGEKRIQTLVGDLNHEVKSVARRLKESILTGSIRLSHAGVTGEAIDQLMSRPSNKDITPVNWGKLFMVSVSMWKFEELKEKNK